MDSQQALIEKSLLQAARTVEQQLDSQLKKLDNLEEGDLEAIRRKRLEELKRCVVVDYFHGQGKDYRYHSGHLRYIETRFEKMIGYLEDMAS